MALDGTYAGLLASVADFLNRSDLTATIPDFIRLAEADMNRKLRTRLMTGNVTASVNSEYEVVPSDFAGSISMQSSTGQPLREMSPGALNQAKYEANSPTGPPTAYAVVNGAFQFLPAPNAALTISMTYYQRIPALSAGANWLFTNHPDVYLYGSLVAAAPYLQDDARTSIWGGLYQNAIDSILDADRERWGELLAPQPSSSQIV